MATKKLKIRDSAHNCCCSGGACFIQCSTRGGTAQLCGEDAFQDPVVPPKRWRTLTFGGSYLDCEYSSGDCSGTPFFTESGVYSGTKSYSQTTCAIIDTTLSAFGRNSHVSCGAQTLTEFHPGEFLAPFSDPAVCDHTQTSIHDDYNFDKGCVAGNISGFTRSWTGEVTRDLSDEDTESDAINRIPGINTWSDYTTCLDVFCCRTTRQIRGAGQFDFEYVEARFQVKGTNFQPAVSVQVRVDVLRKPYGTGSYFLYQTVEQDATPDAMGNFTADFGVIANDVGYETTVNNCRTLPIT